MGHYYSKIKQFFKDNEERIVSFLVTILIAIIAFNLGRLSKREEKLKIIDRGERLVLEFKGRNEEGALLFKTLPQATVKLGETELIDLDADGNFSLPSSSLKNNLVVYTDKDLIQIDLAGFLKEIKGDKDKKDKDEEEVLSYKRTDARGEDKATEEKIFVGSRKSDKYHLKDCPWAERIKEENRVWFSSQEEAEERGYKPARCIKEAGE